MATLKQMIVRANSGHRIALAYIAEGRPVARPSASLGELRGWSTVLSTLSRWGCVVVVDGRSQLTDIGRELLAALRNSSLCREMA